MVKCNECDNELNRNKLIKFKNEERYLCHQCYFDKYIGKEIPKHIKEYLFNRLKDQIEPSDINTLKFWIGLEDL